MGFFILSQLGKLIGMNEIKVQEFTQLAPSTSFTLGYDDGFIFAYRIKNTFDKENPIYTFNHTGYLDIKVEEITYKYSKTIKILKIIDASN
jgi:hypothetical protein